MDTKWLPDLGGQPGPKYRALAEVLRADIRSGRLPPGTRLPPVRDLAWALQVTPGTVARAYQRATEDGLIEATVGRGTFVRDTAGADAPPPDTGWPRLALPESAGPGPVDFLVSRAVEVGQSQTICDLAAGILRDGLSFTRYLADPDDLASCRGAAADWLGTRGTPGRAEDLVLTEGALNGVFLALQASLRGRDPVVLTDSLTYPGFRRAIRAVHARQVAFASDAEGPIPESVAEACARHPVQAILVSLNAHNPTAGGTSPARRAALADLARRHDVCLIEDDTYGLALPDRSPGFRSLCPERAWFTASLSKCVAAGLRVGFLLCPPGRSAQVGRGLSGIGVHHAPLGIALMQRLLVSGTADRITGEVMRETEARVSLACERLRDFGPVSRAALNFLWLPLPGPWRTTGFVTACERQGLRVAGADIFSDPGQPAPDAVRLSLAGPADRAGLDSALTLLARLLATPPADLVA